GRTRTAAAIGNPEPLGRDKKISSRATPAPRLCCKKPVRRTGTDWTRSVSPGTRCLPDLAGRRPHWTSCRREGRLADSHLTCPLIMHAFGPPPLPCTSHVIRPVAGQAREFRRAPNHSVGRNTGAAEHRGRTTM